MMIFLWFAVFILSTRPTGCVSNCPSMRNEVQESSEIQEFGQPPINIMGEMICLNLTRRELCDSTRSNSVPPNCPKMSTGQYYNITCLCREDLQRHICLTKSVSTNQQTTSMPEHPAMPSTGYTQISMTAYDGIQTEMSNVMTNHEPGSNVCTDKCETQLAVLGVLVGLLMMVLVVMTTGWVWTCQIMKKRGAKREILIEQDRENHDLQEHQLHNPIYGKDNNSKQPRPTGQTNTVLYQPEPAAITAGVNNHHCTGSPGDSEEKEQNHHENVYHILENPAGDSDDYEELDKYEKEGQNNQEENVYHVLDGPTVVEEEPGSACDN